MCWTVVAQAFNPYREVSDSEFEASLVQDS